CGGSTAGLAAARPDRAAAAPGQHRLPAGQLFPDPMTRRYASFDPAPTSPAFAVPPGACDSHFHVFGPRERYPVLPGIEHDMPEADVAAMQRLHAALGIERGVICASTVNGSNHQVLLDALATLGPGYRACAVFNVLEDHPDSYIARLHDAGVRGI